VAQPINATAVADLSAVVSLSDRVAQRLTADITSTGMQPGDRLPSERDLTTRYAVSRVTMRSALRKVELDGLISAAPSRGWFVTTREAHRNDKPGGTAWRPNVTDDRVLGFTEQAAERGLSVRSRVLRHQVRAADVSEADQLHMAPGGDLVDLLRVRYLDGVAIVVEHNRLPLAVCPALATTDFETHSLYETLRRSTPPQVPMSAEYSVEARAATVEEAEMLELLDALPVLVATTLTSNVDGRPIELTYSSYRGDRYRYRARIVATDPRS